MTSTDGHRHSRTASALVTALRGLSRPGKAEPARRALGRAIRARLARVWDPRVRFDLAGSQLLFHLSHDSPWHYLWEPLYGRGLARIARLAASKYADMTAVDIGANVGDSAAILRSAGNFPILCIEGAGVYADLLQLNARRVGNVEVVHALVGPPTETMGIQVAHGTGRVTPARGGTDEPADAEVDVLSLEDILEMHPRFLESRLVKIDLDGFDCVVIEQSVDFLNRQRPILFFEYSPYLLADYRDPAFPIFEILRELGYDKTVVYANTGEYLLFGSLAEASTVEEIKALCAWPGKGGLVYCDICVFQSADAELAAELADAS